ncbi:alanine--glyoxylate aminotransferase family protein [Candidatus Woesearchaeota archaeon]|nr:alanine--glyoxylate aminotransferase family protein [Candidatus Woesearchaeota archaeon]
MKNIFFTPGPTQLYESVKSHIKEAIEKDICSISHRGSEFQSIFQGTVLSLKKLLGIPKNSHVFFVSSATEAMERIAENCIEKHSFHFVNGEFSKRLFEAVQELKKSPEKTEAEPWEEFNFNVRIPGYAELICFTQNETSTGASVEMDRICQIKKENPEKLVAIDIVSSVPYADVDYSLVDCAFFSVQKGFGMPAGLGIIVANEKAIEKSRALLDKNLNIGTYHNFISLLTSSQKSQTPETPNVLEIFLLGKIAEELGSKGIENIRKETEEKADAIYNFFDSHSSYKPFIKNRSIRSKTVITINVDNSKEAIKKLSEHGFIVGAGYKNYKDRQIRIANFPMHRIEDVKRLLEVI